MTFTLANLDSEKAAAINDAEIGADNLSLDIQVVDHDKVAELALLAPLEYDRVREATAEQMGVRVTTLDAAVNPITRGIVTV